MTALAEWLGPLRPVLNALLLPPGLWLPLLALAWALRRRRAATAAFVVSGLGLWLSLCGGTARWLQDHWLRPPPPPSLQRLAALRAEAARLPTVILVLGAGRRERAADTGRGSLSPNGQLRLDHGLWLAARTGLPLAYAGGVGWAERGRLSEAEVAAQVVQERGAVLRWQEGRSRDTAGNAREILPRLQAAGIRRVLLVTQAVHMPRALRWFQAEAVPRGIDILPAATDYLDVAEEGLLAWLPSGEGAHRVHQAVHEIVGLWLTPDAPPAPPGAAPPPAPAAR